MPGDYRIPIVRPDPPSMDDAERLYALCDECTLGVDVDGSHVLVDDDPATIGRVVDRLLQAGYVIGTRQALATIGASTEETPLSPGG